MRFNGAHAQESVIRCYHCIIANIALECPMLSANLYSDASLIMALAFQWLFDGKSLMATRWHSMYLSQFRNPSASEALEQFVGVKTS